MSLIVNNPRDIVSFSSLSPYYTAGDSLTLNCTITAYQLSPVITTKVTSYFKHNNIIITSHTFDVTIHELYMFSLIKSFTNLKLSNAGNYTCSYFLSNNSFVKSSDVKSVAVNAIVRSELVFYLLKVLFDY